MATKKSPKNSSPSEGIELNYEKRYNQFKKELDELLERYEFVLKPRVRVTTNGIFPYLDVDEKPEENE